MRTIHIVILAGLISLAPAVSVADYGMTVIVPEEHIAGFDLQEAVRDGVEGAMDAFAQQNDPSVPENMSITYWIVPYTDCRDVASVVNRTLHDSDNAVAIINAAHPMCIQGDADIIKINLISLNEHESEDDPFFVYNQANLGPERHNNYMQRSLPSQEDNDIYSNPGAEVFFESFMRQTGGAPSIPLVSVAAYDATLLVLHAINGVGLDADVAHIRGEYEDILDAVDELGEPPIVIQMPNDCDECPCSECFKCCF